MAELSHRQLEPVHRFDLNVVAGDKIAPVGAARPRHEDLTREGCQNSGSARNRALTPFKARAVNPTPMVIRLPIASATRLLIA
jgi:hypothetical protein